jgi:uncharacterized protein YgfB (UPF0149 family)
MSYWIINAIVMQSDAELTAAHAHGMATGMLCVNEQTQCAQWLAELFRQVRPTTDEYNTRMDGAFASEEISLPDAFADYQQREQLPGTELEHLFEQTQSLLVSDEFEFDLFLPDDDTLLSERVEALTYWCQGFLLGVSFRDAPSKWSKEASEILKDIVEFTKLDTAAEGEEDESDFMEITEYMRSAVLLLRSDTIKKV